MYLPEYIYNVQGLASRGWNGFRYRFGIFCHDISVASEEHGKSCDFTLNLVLPQARCCSGDRGSKLRSCEEQH